MSPSKRRFTVPKTGRNHFQDISIDRVALELLPIGKQCRRQKRRVIARKDAGPSSFARMLECADAPQSRAFKVVHGITVTLDLMFRWSCSNAAITIAGIELMHRIRKGEFNLAARFKEAAAPAVWNAVLSA